MDASTHELGRCDGGGEARHYLEEQLEGRRGQAAVRVRRPTSYFYAFQLVSALGMGPFKFKKLERTSSTITSSAPLYKAPLVRVPTIQRGGEGTARVRFEVGLPCPFRPGLTVGGGCRQRQPPPVQRPSGRRPRSFWRHLPGAGGASKPRRRRRRRGRSFGRRRWRWRQRRRWRAAVASTAALSRYTPPDSRTPFTARDNNHPLISIHAHSHSLSLTLYPKP